VSDGGEGHDDGESIAGRSGRKAQRYTRADGRADGYRGLPPWRRGYQPAYLVISLALVAGLLTIFLIAGSRLP
jgi:hypothetical protein